jgi:hypothetical protein
MSPQNRSTFREVIHRALVALTFSGLCLFAAPAFAKTSAKAKDPDDAPKKTAKAKASQPKAAKADATEAGPAKEDIASKADTKPAAKGAEKTKTAAKTEKTEAAPKEEAPAKSAKAEKAGEGAKVAKNSKGEKPAEPAEAPAKPTPADAKAKTAPATVAETKPAKPAEPAGPPRITSASAVSFVVSVPEQRIYVFDAAGEKVTSYRVSTSSHGLGDGRGTYATPLGYLEVAAKIGDQAPVGAVFKGGHRTGEVCAINAPGRDPIVTRILHLRGLESGNASAYARCIYIHGTPDERKIGRQVSYGCIRMRSVDVIDLFDRASVGTRVEITQDRVSNMFGSVVRAPAPIGAVTSPPIKPLPGMIAKTGEVSPVAESPASSKGATMAANSKIALSAGRGKSAAELSPTPPAKSEPGAKNSHVKLMENSILTFQFGGGTERDGRDR